MESSDSELESQTNNDVCCVCGDAEGVSEDAVLVYCDGQGKDNAPCDVVVHPHCCGAPLINHIPEDEWFCDKCTAAKDVENRTIECVLCGGAEGLLKRTSCSRWAHVSCALWLPEAFFVDAEYRDPIDVLHIPEFRWNQTCDVCQSTKGACLECSDPSCQKMFHARCALEKDLWLQYKQSNKKGGADIIVGLCAVHSDRWKRECMTKGLRYN
jgi:NuA3 HAT complex component NTO1